MTTHIVCIVSKKTANGTLDIPPAAWTALARDLGARFNADVTVQNCPAETGTDGHEEREPVYTIDVSITGDARPDVSAVIEQMDPAIDELIAKYMHTNIPLAR